MYVDCHIVSHKSVRYGFLRSHYQTIVTHAACELVECGDHRGHTDAAYQFTHLVLQINYDCRWWCMQTYNNSVRQVLINCYPHNCEDIKIQLYSLNMHTQQRNYAALGKERKMFCTLLTGHTSGRSRRCFHLLSGRLFYIQSSSLSGRMDRQEQSAWMSHRPFPCLFECSSMRDKEGWELKDRMTEKREDSFSHCAFFRENSEAVGPWSVLQSLYTEEVNTACHVKERKDSPIRSFLPDLTVQDMRRDCFTNKVHDWINCAVYGMMSTILTWNRQYLRRQ